jgi:acyl-CoA synthetase (AMP-forming)/AMP-acid ligase II
MSGSPFCEALARQVRDRGGEPALASEGERLSLTFRDVADRVAAWQAALPAFEGMAALATGHSASFVELFYALRGRGAAVLSLDAGLGAGLPDVARRMRAAVLLHRDPSLGGDSLPGSPDPAVRLLRTGAVETPPAGTAIAKMTSGSTLHPRAACFTEEALVEGVDHLREGMELAASDRVLVAIPLSHSYGFDSALLSLAAIGTPLVLQPDVFPAALLATMRDRGITFFPAVPALIRALAGVEWPRPLALRRVICASAPLSVEDARAFARASGVAVQQFLGATECGGIAFERRPADPASEGCVGQPLPGVRIELHAEGIRVHSKANRFAVLPPEEVSPWVETGDRACLTREDRLRLLGRAQLTAKIGGFRIDLGAIDAFLRGLPGVAEAAALPIEDAFRGDRVVAYVEAREQTPERILELCRERLSAREVPSEIRVMDSLPRNGRGKLDREALRGIANRESGIGAEASPPAPLGGGGTP